MALGFSDFGLNPIVVGLPGRDVKVGGDDPAIVGTPPFLPDDAQAQIPIPIPPYILPLPKLPDLGGIFGGGVRDALKPTLNEATKLLLGIMLYLLLAMGIFALIWPQGPGMALADKVLGDDDKPPANPDPSPQPAIEPAPSSSSAGSSGKAAKAKKVAKIAELAA